MEGADHSFDVLKKSGIGREQIYYEMAKAIDDFLKG